MVDNKQHLKILIQTIALLGSLSQQRQPEPQPPISLPPSSIPHSISNLSIAPNLSSDDPSNDIEVTEDDPALTDLEADAADAAEQEYIYGLVAAHHPSMLDVRDNNNNNHDNDDDLSNNFPIFPSQPSQLIPTALSTPAKRQHPSSSSSPQILSAPPTGFGNNKTKKGDIDDVIELLRASIEILSKIRGRNGSERQKRQFILCFSELAALYMEKYGEN
ncbi:hypothetical protein CI109_100109 [Kwoniella shandongensis]|uniref:Uncharacterized protein n=1 Tax=Kwoniella shandongensis TaxID=1734106 RepID=A0A5M6BRH5_9TREE|nr:uncharacterized protein CI109_007495 [Kwoniella shandongensis]KAA5524195.1 hypothetical protein CI109_007495 [Kwoniella shandongensis]